LRFLIAVGASSCQPRSKHSCICRLHTFCQLSCKKHLECRAQQCTTAPQHPRPCASLHTLTAPCALQHFYPPPQAAID
jgi:hypothetical protein